MMKPSCLLALSLAALCFAAAAVAAPLDRDLICSQPLDISQPKVGSEINDSEGYESEVANDCFAPSDGSITMVRWWGGYIDGGPGDPDVSIFDLRFYTDNDCTPDQVIAELLGQHPLISYVGDDPWGYATFLYELVVDVHLSEGIFWFGVQGRHDGYPPKHGRAGDGSDNLGRETCETMFKSETDGYPDWTPIHIVLDMPWTASQEFEFEPDPTPSETVSWGTVKSFYR